MRIGIIKREALDDLFPYQDTEVCSYARFGNIPFELRSSERINTWCRMDMATISDYQCAI